MNGGLLTVGVDIGGTSARAALVDVGGTHGAPGTVLTTAAAPTARDPEGLDATVVDLVGGVARGHDVAAVGLAVAGFVDPERRSVSFGAHLPWRDDPVVERLGRRLGLPVTLEHDANAAALAEHRVGAAAGSSVALLMALGTGIGAGLVVGGRLYRGAFGVAPELGHLTVVPDGRPCPCGKRGCLERYCSGTALARSAREALDAGDESSRLRAVGPGALSGRAVAEAAAAGDGVARRALDDFAGWLGRGIALVADVFDPDRMVVAGEVSASASLYLDAAVDVYRERVTGAGHRRLADVRAAVLGGRAGMVGAALDAAERGVGQPRG